MTITITGIQDIANLLTDEVLARVEDFNCLELKAFLINYATLAGCLSQISVINNEESRRILQSTENARICFYNVKSAAEESLHVLEELLQTHDKGPE